jgi:hypothetical protein
MRTAPAPIIMRGDGMGTMICSMITPMKTESWPWVLIDSIIHCVISEIKGALLKRNFQFSYFITSPKISVK